MKSPRTSILGAAAVLVTSAAVTAVGATSAGAVAPDDGTVFINEIHYDNTGTDAGEAIEVAGPAGTDLTGWTVVLYNGANGAPYDTDALSGTLTDEAGGFGTTSISYPSNGIQNGAPDGVALVDNCGLLEQFLSYEGTFTAVGGPADGLTSTDIGAAQSGSGPVGESLGLTGTGASYGDFTWALGTASFDAVNPGQTFSGPVDPVDTSCPEPDECVDPPAIAPIGTVQGSGVESPCGGETVTIEGIVVGDYEGAAPALRGFYVQQADESHDADPATSEAIFVFHGSENTVSLGDRVSVTGDVSEFEGQTQIDFPDAVEVLASGVSVTPTDVTLPVASPTALEAVEGMLVHMPQELIVTEHFQLGRFGQIFVSSGGRLAQPTQVVEPGAPAIAMQAANNLNRLIVDDALNNQNRDPIVFGRGGNPLSATNTLRGGDTMTGAVGVLTYTWAGASASGNAYRLRPEGDLSDAGLVPGGKQTIPAFRAANPRPDGPGDIPGALRMANLNVLNYFLTLDVGATPACGPDGFKQECRGAETALELERQRVKLLAAIAKLDADVVGLAELENTPGVEPMEDIVDGLNAMDGVGPYAYIDTGVIGTDTIKVGIIYRTGEVTPTGPHAILDSTVDPNFNDDLNRPSLAQSFVENSTGEVFTVVANHLKSKSCTGATGADADQGDGQACWNPTRVAAATALVRWLADHPTDVVDDDVQILGDLNSYAMEDPIDVLRSAGYVDLGEVSGDGYSFAFDGQWGTLDYSLSSPSLFAQLTAADEYHINSDEPNVLDYNTNFKSAGQIVSLFAPDEFRVSDHDPLVAGFDLDSGMGDSSVVPNQLWPPNHKYRTVTALVTDAEAAIVDGTSSEADSGLGPDDLPNDIVIDGDATARLRAERFSRQGRTYTLDLVVTNGSQTRFDTATVRVPHSV